MLKYNWMDAKTFDEEMGLYAQQKEYESEYKQDAQLQMITEQKNNGTITQEEYDKLYRSIFGLKEKDE